MLYGTQSAIACCSSIHVPLSCSRVLGQFGDAKAVMCSFFSALSE